LVSTKKSYVWTQGSGEWSLNPSSTRIDESKCGEITPFAKGGGERSEAGDLKNSPFVIVYDYGVKQHILEILIDMGCRVTVVPAKTPAEEVLSQNPDGILLSNGPGDPQVCDYAISAIRTLMQQNIPLFGICLGFQLMALAAGARTFKMKFGHHGANHPVSCVEEENRVMITSQNHGFAVDEKTLPECFRVTHRSLFDQSLQGFRHLSKPFFGFQGHPEASPGPQEAYELFGRFFDSMHNK
jgi:carbamoyl-phosphate synthase small subunit